ncbi:hypothetical protein [Nocardioides sp. CER19]|uniref:hypothetical protein n=1 Tax=Nocardioides sp. CER19 TaxID=3038538 RepID=UPI00244B5197|nr:hypothetical protein [Nocardioides sp. CER19]MDH2413746.1 hypothetical protein [Nocardioides sp. CER19]
MTATVPAASCGDAHNHEWKLKSIDFEDFGSVSVFECLLCGRADHRDGSVR